MKVKFWKVPGGVIGLTMEVENDNEEKSLAKIREGLKQPHFISMELGGKAYKGSLSSWDEGRKGLFTKVTKVIEMNFRPA